MKLTHPKRQSALAASDVKAARAAEGRRNTREKNKLEGLDEAPKPISIENAGEIGEKMEKEIAEYRKKLESECQRQIGQGNHRVRLRTLKESILNAINAFKTGGRIKKLPDAIEQLPQGELYPYLPRFDWRDYKVVPAVRNQDQSSLCWAFTATQIYESSLMIQRANFAINNLPEAPNAFRIDKVELNARSTWECMNPDDPDAMMAGGRYEAAFNFYTLRGISPNSIKLFLGVPVTDAPGDNLHIEERIFVEHGSSSESFRNPVSLTETSASQPQIPAVSTKDAELPNGHCKDGTRKIKAIGWDYVKPKNQWNVPPRNDLKKALLEHGPIAVAMNQNGFTEYGEQKIDSHCTEIGRNRETGVIFKKDPVSNDLFVRFPRKAFRAVLKEALMSEEEIVKTEGQDAIKLLCPDTYVNLNLTRLELNDWMIGQRTNPYQILGVAADCIQKRRHLRRAKQDSDVGTFYDREPDEVIWHFPASNEVQLKKKKAGDWCLSFPANTEATFTRNADGLFITFPAGKEFEDLSPVFCPDPKAPNNHEVMLVGWDDQKHAWIVQNSWGEDWGFRCHAERGTRGFAYIAYGTFGQFAAWLEARLLDKKLWGATTT